MRLLKTGSFVCLCRLHSLLALALGEKLGFSVPSVKIYFCLLDIHKSNSITRPGMERTVPIPPYLILTISFHNLKVTIEQIQNHITDAIIDTQSIKYFQFVPVFLIRPVKL